MSSEEEAMALLQRENSALRERVAHLEQAAAKIETLWSIMSEVVLVADREGRYLEIAPTRAFPPEVARKLVGQRIDALFPPSVSQQLLAGIAQSLATGEAGFLKYPLQLPGGETWRSAAFKPISGSEVIWFSHDITPERQLAQAELRLRTFEVIVENAPAGISLISSDGAFAYANQAYRALTGHGEQLLAKTLFDVHAASREAAASALQEALAAGSWEGSLSLTRPGRDDLPCQVSIVKLPGDVEQARSLAMIAQDMTPFLEAEQQRLLLQEQVIEAQRAALRELSTPLVPLAERVIAMPLIGTIDSTRAQEVMEKLLEGIVERQAHTAILDVTGVRVIDSEVADGLLRAARAAKLLGAQVILTGIGPHIAQTLVHLQADLSGVVTRSDLQSGIAYALRKAGGT